MTAFATQSNIDMSGPGLLGSDVVGSSRRKSKRITIGTGLTLSGGVLSNSLDLSGYVQKTSATGSLILPSGTTAERDGSPTAGYSRWNTTTSRFERWTGSIWENYVRLSGDTMSGSLTIGDYPNVLRLGTAGSYRGEWYTTGGTVGLDVYSATDVRFWVNGDALWLKSGEAIIPGGSLAFASGFGSTRDIVIKRAAAGVLADRNGINAQCFLLNKSYTSDSSQEAMMLDAGKQISGKLGLYSYRGSSGGSNYPIQIGMLAADGSTFSGLSVATDGIVSSTSGIRAGSATEYIILDSSTTSAITAYSNALGAHYQLIGDSTGSGGPMLFKSGAGGMFAWQSTGRADAGATDLTLSRNSANVMQIGTAGANSSGSLLLTNLTASGVTKIILPTSDPHILGCLWNNSGTITISAG